jgi:hypothetical protein
MKKSEINNYIRKYILPSYNQYYVDQYVMYQTFDSEFFIKGYLFYSKGDNELGLRVSYFIMPLFVKKECLVTTIGEEILNIKIQGLFKKVKEVWWDTRKENQASTFEKINKSISEQGEPILNSIINAKELSKRLKKEMRDNIRVYEVVAYSSILFASVEEQDKMLKGLIKEAENERDVYWVHQIKKDAVLMLSIESTEERIKLLKTWANETIGHLKLPHVKPFEV